MSESNKSNKDILQAPRGMRDFYGTPYQQKSNFFEYARMIASSYGFTGIETPILEHTEIFLKGIGEGTDIIDKEMYNLTTLGGDRLTLKPEGTAPIMRAYIEHGMGALPQPQLFYYESPFFRHDKPQKGRYRQFYQFGLEIMGSRDPLYDALTIEVGYRIIQKTGKKVVVKINSLGTRDIRASYTETLVAFYREHQSKLAEGDQERIDTNPFRILDSKEPETVTVNQSAPTLIESLDKASRDHFTSVTDTLDGLDIPYEINPFLVRGMDYYEHTVFEYVTYDNENQESFALGGGGRYDGLAELIGHTTSIPSVGLGLGADRIIEISDDTFTTNPGDRIPMIVTENSLYVHASQLLQKCTNNKLFMYPLFTKIGKQMSRIEKEGYTRVCIIGEDEATNQQVTYKDLTTGEQRTLSYKELNNLS